MKTFSPAISGHLLERHEKQCCGGEMVPDSMVCCGGDMHGQTYTGRANMSCCGHTYTSDDKSLCCTSDTGHVKVSAVLSTTQFSTIVLGPVVQSIVSLTSLIMTNS